MNLARLSRRDFLRLAGLSAAAGVVSACAPTYRRISGLLAPAAPFSSEEWEALARAKHFEALQRLTFGPQPAERLEASQIGITAWIEAQLDPGSLADDACSLRLRAFPSLEMDASDLVDISDRLFDEVDRSTIPNELRQAALLRQVYSKRQILETLVDFWNDHFNISVDKGDCYFLKTVDDREVIRAHALGNFRELLWASAHSPAMLVYLDNQVNQKESPNENYARELLELHTLGVLSGYTQIDVMELARCLTGWSVKERLWRGQFTFHLEQHDPGTKELLGLFIEPAGQSETERVLDHLALHPQTAEYVVRRLARRLVSDPPPEALVQRASQVFLQTRGDIKSILRVLLLDGRAYHRPRYKRPSHFIASSLRLLQADTDAGPAVQDYLLRLGQPYFGWPTPDGFPEADAAWQGNLLPRWQFAQALASDQLPGTTSGLQNYTQDAASPKALTDRLGLLLLGRPLPPARRARLLQILQTGTDDHLPARLAAALLSSPEFQWR